MRSALEENRAWKCDREYAQWQRWRGSGYSIFKIDRQWKTSIWKYLRTHLEVSEQVSPVDIQERVFQAQKTANAKALWQKYVPGV